MGAALRKRGFDDNSEQLMLKYTTEQQRGGCHSVCTASLFPCKQKRTEDRQWQ